MPSPKRLRYSQHQVHSLDSLPNELLLAIINEFRPDINAYLPPYVRRQYQYTDDFKYFEQVRFLASLRLINSFWSHLIAPVLFKTFVCEPQWGLSKDVEIFKNHGGLVHHLILRAYKLREPFTKHELLAACLAQCTSLTTLDFVGISDLLMGPRKGDVRKMFGALDGHLALKSVSFRPACNYQRNVDSKYNMTYGISHALVGMGKAIESITELRISHWANSRRRDYTYKLHLPSELPNLTRLCLENVRKLTNDDVHKLISRVGRTERGGDGEVRRVVSLRELEIDDGSGDFINYRTLRNVLQINHLGEGLTTLLFYCGRAVISDIQELESLPLFILSTCPNLVRFHFTPPCNARVLERLSPKLREFGLKIADPDPEMTPSLPRSMITSHDTIIKFLASPAARRLAGMTLMVAWATMDWDYDWDDIVEEACIPVGIYFRGWPG
ncbi:hypothetical protein AX16_004840 [Volvariella volvacea WC 439]|nr:hypothetical protein AX16_004840 [Volvariella volvacea WC 439]